MQRLFSAKPVLAAAIALGGLAAVSGAHARSLSDLLVSINVQAPVRHVQAAPVPRVQPAPVPVHVQRTPGYVQPRAVHGSQRSYDARSARGDADRDGIPNRYDRHPGYDDRRVASSAGWGDADRDGVPNRYDRAPRNPYRR